MFDLTGKRALVTGSTQGIGYAIARALIDRGADVFVHCSRDVEKASRIAKETGGAGYVVGDLGEYGCAKRFFDTTGALDIVVANASVQIRRSWNEIGADEFDRQISVNLRSTLELMQVYIPYMQERKWGRFLAVGSVQQFRPNVQMAAYAASKCGVQSLVENIARQVGADGVTVNNLVPGVIATPRNYEALSDPEYLEKIIRRIPAGYIGEAYDCAGAALLLCSDEGRYITGTTLCVDGGMSVG